MVVCGVQKEDPMKKWQFRAILSEELMKFIAVVDTDKMKDLHS